MSSFENFVKCRVVSPVAAAATDIALHEAVEPFSLPPEEGGILVLTDSPNNPSVIEVIRYGYRNALGLYDVQRGQEGTAAVAWTGPVYCYQSLMAGDFQALLDSKVDKAAGQSLMTDAERTKLGGIQAGAQVNSVTSVAGRTGAVALAKGDVGLGNVDNTSDANKPVSTAQQAALNAKAPLASPALTGTPTAPTPAAGTNTTQIATAAFVQAALAALVNGAPGALDQLNELAAAMGNDPNFATTMLNALAAKASLDSPALTGNPTAPTPASTDNDASIATTAFTKNALGLFGLSDPATQAAWHTGNLVKQTNVDDLTAGRMVLTETVRRRLIGGFSGVYCDRLILLHPLYVSTLLPYSIVDGKFTATRGSAGSSLNQAVAEVVSSSAYNAHVTSFYDLSGNPAEPWQAVSCMYQGVKYAALILPYQASAYSGGIFFEGRVLSDDPNQLRCIEYYSRQTATVLNSEVYNSIGPLYTQKDFRVSGSRVFHTGNILGTVSQSAGVPTGAIIERGSNANGEYIKWADGTLECWQRSVTVECVADVDLDVTWPLPAAFNAVNAAATCTLRSPATTNVFTVHKLQGNHTSAAACTMRVRFSVTQSYLLTFHAIGRWY